MTEQTQSAIGTVAQEAARLIEEMALMARSSFRRPDDLHEHAGGPDGEPVCPGVPPAAEGGRGSRESKANSHEATAAPPEHACSICGAERDDIPTGDTPTACRLCPLCRGIDLLRSVRPETVDLLADLAMSVAAGLRDAATRSRAADPRSSARPTPGRPPRSDKTSVQDIQVDDESEG